MANTVVMLPDRLRQIACLVHNMKVAAQDLCVTLWPDGEQLSSIFTLADKLMQSSM